MSDDSSRAESRLRALQCHFTWDLDKSTSKLLRIKDKLIDIGPEDSNVWLGHIYNLQGFIRYKLGLSEDALRFFNEATEAFARIRSCPEGPWLEVNYGNLAWLHHELGQQAESEAYLSKLEALMKEHPAPLKDELHPEVYAEKAWSLMKFSNDQKLLAAELFEKAIEMQPDRAEWRTSQVLALVSAHKHSKTGVEDDILKKMKMAQELDPENLYLAAECLNQRAKKGDNMEDEASELITKILENPASSYCGIKILLRIFRFFVSEDVGIYWAEEALEKHPESRFLKRCLALCYKWKIVFHKDGALNQSLVNKAVSLLKEVISLYPDTSLVKEIDLADVYAKSNQSKAEEVYQKLLQREMEPADKQMFFNRYAKHLQFNLQDTHKCIKYHMKAALIDHESFFRENSIKALESLKKRGWETIRAEIEMSSQNIKLEELECHFTWEMHRNVGILHSVKNRLIDIGPEDSNMWLGHIYNLQGFIRYKLGLSEDALRFFNEATEAFARIRSCPEGPWLEVNYGNLAWLHHELGQQAESEAYLSKLEALMKEHPAPLKDELHPEVYAEKAWSLMKFSNDKKLLAVDLFEKAIEMQPDRAEWRIEQVVALLNAHKHSRTGVDDDILKKMKMAQELAPENMFLAAEYLNQRVKKGENVKIEASELATRILENPVSSYSGIKALLVLYRSALSVDAAVDLAEKAVEKHPESRYLKRCLIMCYKWKIVFQSGNVSQDLIDKASLQLKEVISLYPDDSLQQEIDLANIYGKSNHSFTQANQIYQELLQRDLEESSKQMLYNHYAKFMRFVKRDRYKCIEYHIKAAEIPIKSYYRSNSIEILQRMRPTTTNYRMRLRIEEFLDKLHDI